MDSLVFNPTIGSVETVPMDIDDPPGSSPERKALVLAPELSTADCTAPEDRKGENFSEKDYRAKSYPVYVSYVASYYVF